MPARIRSLHVDSFTGPGAGTTVTITVPTSSGSNRYGYLVLQHNNNVTPTSVTYAGVAMTKIVNQYQAQNSYLDVYEIANPTEGSNPLVFTYPAYQEYGQNIAFFYVSCVDAAGYRNTANNTGATPLAVNLPAPLAGSAILLISLIPSIYFTQAMTIDGTEVTEYYAAVGYNLNYGAVGYKEDVSGGNSTITPQYAYQMYGVAVEIKAAAAPPSARRIFVVG